MFLLVAQLADATGFIGGTKSFEGALKMAEGALDGADMSAPKRQRVALEIVQ